MFRDNQHACRVPAVDSSTEYLPAVHVSVLSVVDLWLHCADIWSVITVLCAEIWRYDSSSPWCNCRMSRYSLEAPRWAGYDCLLSWPGQIKIFQGKFHCWNSHLLAFVINAYMVIFSLCWAYSSKCDLLFSDLNKSGSSKASSTVEAFISSHFYRNLWLHSYLFIVRNILFKCDLLFF